MNKTGIEWTQRSVNPIRARRKDNGKVGWHCVTYSPGCMRCYSAALNKRFGTGLPYVQRSSDLVDIFLDDRALSAILKVKESQFVFPCDMTDLFMKGVSVEDIAAIFATFAVARWHTFQVLTKRADRMAAILGDPAFPPLVGRMIGERVRPLIDGKIKGDWSLVSPTEADLKRGRGWPLPNVWTGFSAENQECYDRRAAATAEMSRAGWLVWVSAEPLLGEINLRLDDGNRGIRWIVTGGESGPSSRPCNLSWIRSIVRQCKDAGVPAFVKQLGSRPYDGGAIARVPGADVTVGYEEAVSPAGLDLLQECLEASVVRLVDRKGGDIGEFPDDLRVREFPVPVGAGLGSTRLPRPAQMDLLGGSEASGYA